MKSFKVWIEARQEKLSDFLDIVLNTMNLDVDNGASTPIESLNKQNFLSKLQNLDIFKNLSTKKKESIKSKINSEKNGTVLDVIKLMAGYE